MRFKLEKEYASEHTCDNSTRYIRITKLKINNEKTLDLPAISYVTYDDRRDLRFSMIDIRHGARNILDDLSQRLQLKLERVKNDYQLALVTDLDEYYYYYYYYKGNTYIGNIDNIPKDYINNTHVRLYNHEECKIYYGLRKYNNVLIDPKHIISSKNISLILEDLKNSPNDRLKLNIGKAFSHSSRSGQYQHYKSVEVHDSNGNKIGMLNNVVPYFRIISNNYKLFPFDEDFQNSYFTAAKLGNNYVGCISDQNGECRKFYGLNPDSFGYEHDNNSGPYPYYYNLENLGNFLEVDMKVKDVIDLEKKIKDLEKKIKDLENKIEKVIKMSGPEGPKGDKGLPGIKGDTGPQGIQGPKGFNGTDGTPGQKGNAGLQGPIGFNGTDGLPGAPGLPGVDGLPGTPGSKGDAGLPGQKGDRGETPNATEIATELVISKKAELGKAVLEVKDSQGKKILVNDPALQQGVAKKLRENPGQTKGETGFPGLRGDKGKIGAPGASGQKGSKGETGLPGFKGDEGDYGYPGHRGDKGSPGFDGLMGLQGFNGTDGSPGQKGDKGETPNATEIVTELVISKKAELGQAVLDANDSSGKNLATQIASEVRLNPKYFVNKVDATQLTEGIANKLSPEIAKNITQNIVDAITGDAVKQNNPDPNAFKKYEKFAETLAQLLVDKSAINREEANALVKGKVSDWGLARYIVLGSYFNDKENATEIVKQNVNREKLAEYLLKEAGLKANNSIPSAEARTTVESLINSFFGTRVSELGQAVLEVENSQGKKILVNDPTLQSGVAEELRKNPGQTKGDKGLSGIKGDIGAPGLPGLEGPAGLNGTDGLPGAPGLEGPAGFNGTDGLPGALGLPGLEGPAGINGTDGLPGAPGLEGPAGLNGTDGLAGAPGLEGPAGFNGTDGSPGAPGLEGPAGLNGTDGLPGAPGLEGPAGINGTDGTPGLDGINGTDGQAGPKGELGEPGNIGTPGPVGLKGEPGIPGLDGPIGFNGTDGTPGQKGDAGLPGPVGVNGTQGEKGGQGDKGETGTPGLPGPHGFNGTQGEQGIQGPIGLNGTQGIQGLTGPAGLNGTDGLPGAPGLEGPAGINGTDGLPGAPGLEGPVGLNGTDGLPGAPGIDGLKGDIGAPGLPGFEGPAGINGTDGTPGQKGDTGLLGVPGLDGPAGINGTDGTQGEKGDVGSPGTAGIEGLKGDIGLPGAIGLEGPAGLNGTDGLPGAPGINGKAGTPGTDGAKGDIGLPGTPGIDGLKGDIGAPGINGKAGTPGTDGAKGDIGLPGTPGIDGLKGDIGAPGLPGFEGPAGLNGTDGIDAEVVDDLLSEINKTKIEIQGAQEAAKVARDDCEGFAKGAEGAKNKTIKLHTEAEQFAKQAEGFKNEANNSANKAFISKQNTNALNCDVKNMLHQINETYTTCAITRKAPIKKREVIQEKYFDSQSVTSSGSRPESMINIAFNAIVTLVGKSSQTLKTVIFPNCTKGQLESTIQQIRDEGGKLLQEANELRQSMNAIGRTHQTADNHIGTYMSNVQISCCHITTQLAGTYP